MLKVALKGLMARKLRTVLTGFSVVLSVAFIVGTFVYTDAIDESFKDLFERTSKGTDVSVQQKLAVDEAFAPPPTMAAETLDQVKSVPGVEEAIGGVSADGTILDDEGEPVLSNGPPTIIASQGPERFDPLTYTEGGPPETADEVVIDKATADKFDFHEGDTVTVAGRAPQKDYRVAGVATLGDSENLAGSRLVTMVLPEAQRVTGHDGYDDISVAAEDGTSPEELKAAIAADLGPKFSVLTGKEQAEKSASDLSGDLGFVRTALLVFAGVSVLVGGFLIFNTFNVTVAQRSREFALLRTLGASRRQVMLSVLSETAVVGLIASIVGIAAGVLLAPAMRDMLAAGGLELGATSFELRPRTVIVGLLVGVIATIVSGFVPARRATRVEPVEAMREAAVGGGGPLRRRRVVVAAALAVLGVAVMLLALTGGAGSDANAVASLLGLGAIILMFGFALVAATLVRPLSEAIGRPLERLRGLTARLARENSRRQPQRTAVTASALMIGVALVVFVAIFGAGIRATVDKGMDQVRAQSIVTHEDGFSPLPEGVVGELESVDGVAAVSPFRFQTGKLVSDGKNVGVTGVDPATVSDAVTVEWADGSPDTVAGLGESDALVSTDFADSNDLAVGDELAFTTRRGDEVDYRVAGTYESSGAAFFGPVTVSNASLMSRWDNAEDVAFALVIGSEGTDPTELRRAEESALASFPTADPQTIDEFKEAQNQAVNEFVRLIYGLLALSVIVALLGVVNTLALSVHERTRELGMLRAVGMARSQVRAMVRAESVITAAIGAILGIVLGIAFAYIVSRPLAADGFVFTLPIITLIVVVILAGLAGVAAAIMPARRAARVDILRAVTTE